MWAKIKKLNYEKNNPLSFTPHLIILITKSSKDLCHLDSCHLRTGDKLPYTSFPTFFLLGQAASHFVM